MSPAKPQSMRWRYENAIEKSGLKPLTRLVLATIARRADAQSGMIPAKFMPAAASLAAATGLSERRVRDHIDLAEKAGWLVVERREGRKAMLALAIPGRDMAAEVTTTPDAVAGTPDVPAHTPDAPSDVTPDAPSDVSDPSVQTVKEDQIIDQSARAREADPPVDNPDSMTDMIISEIENRTQVKITRDHAQLVALQIIGRASSPPDHPIPYVRTAIRREDDPRNFLPTYTPPNARDGMWDRAWARAKARESATDRAVAEAQALKGRLADSDYEDNPGWRYGATGNDRAMQGIEAGRNVQAAIDARARLGEPAPLGAALAEMFGTPAEAAARQASMTHYQRETARHGSAARWSSRDRAPRRAHVLRGENGGAVAWCHP